MIDLKNYITTVPDFPKKGIAFRDISPLLADKYAFALAVKNMADHFNSFGVDKIVGIDARGFIIAGAVAASLNVGVVMARKQGKLPCRVESAEYDLEYGKAVLEIQKDSLKSGDRILLIDDVLATGGTMQAAVNCVTRLNGKIVGLGFMIVLDYLPGRKKFQQFHLFSLVNYQQ